MKCLTEKKVWGEFKQFPPEFQREMTENQFPVGRQYINAFINYFNQI